MISLVSLIGHYSTFPWNELQRVPARAGIVGNRFLVLPGKALARNVHALA